MIKKYTDFINESLLDELKGPDRKESWNKIGRYFFELNEIPETIDEFLDYIFENGYLLNDSESIFRWMFNKKCLFLVMKGQNIMYIYEKLFKIIKGFYDLTLYEFYDIVQNRLIEKFGNFTILKNNIYILED